MAAIDQRLVGSCARLPFAGQLAPGACVFWIRDHAGLKAQVPHVPIIDAAARILLAPVALVEDNAGVQPDCAGKLIIKTGGKHGPLATEGVAHDPDPGRVHLRPLGQDGMRVGGGIGERRQRLDAHRLADRAKIRLGPRLIRRGEVDVRVGFPDRERHKPAPR